MRKSIISGLAVAALSIGAAGAAAATTSLASACCGGVGQEDVPYYVAHDVDLRPSGTTVEGDVSIGVHESETDNRVIGTEQSIDKTGAETNPSDVDPQIVLNPTGGEEVTTVNVPEDIVCVQPSICTPGVHHEVTTGDVGARVFDSSGEDAVTVHHATGSTSVDPGEACVRTTGCNESGSGDGRIASVADPEVSINQ